MQTTIREAREADCERILELVKELALFEKAPLEVTVSLAHFKESGFGKKPIWWAFVAEVNSEIQGFALFYIRFSTWKGQRMYLEDLYVRDEMRGRGLGQMLFDRLRAEVLTRQLNGMMWQVLDWNEPAINFYKKNAAHFDAGWINCSVS